MFGDRALQFKDRLDWSVDVDQSGQEHDQYDAPGTKYFIISDGNGVHQCSMRLRPTTLNTMAMDVFPNLWPSSIRQDSIWESTRFVSRPGVASSARKLAFAVHAFCLAAGVRRVVGVYEGGMDRVYRRIGWSPLRLGSFCDGGTEISGGVWQVGLVEYEALRRSADLPPNEHISLAETCTCRAHESATLALSAADRTVDRVFCRSMIQTHVR